MKKKHPTKAEQKRVTNLLEQLEFLFAVNNFERSLTFMKEEKEEGERLIADVSIDRLYQRILIRIYPSFWNEHIKFQRKALLHEFCHVIIQPIQSVALDLFNGKFRTMKELRDATEESTSKVENLLDAQLKGNNRYARIAYAKYLK